MSSSPPAIGPAPRVLIVEDEPRLRDLLLDVVPSMGFPADAARSAEEAERRLMTDSHQILILDLELPGMNGMDFFAKIRQQPSAAQVIILTGFGSLESARRAVHLDAVEFLCKPCHLDELELALDRARKRVARLGAEPQAGGESPTEASENSHTLHEIEREKILESLRRLNGNRTAAAAELGISRRTLHYRLNEYRRQGHLP